MHRASADHAPVVQAVREIRLSSSIDPQRDPEVRINVPRPNRCEAHPTVIQVVNKLASMGQIVLDVSWMQSPLGQVSLKPLNLGIARRRRRPLPLRLTQKAVNGLRVLAAPAHKSARQMAILPSIDSQTFRNELV